MTDQFDPFVQSVVLPEYDPYDVPLPPPYQASPPDEDKWDNTVSYSARCQSPPRPPSQNAWVVDTQDDTRIQDDNSLTNDQGRASDIETPLEQPMEYGHVAGAFAADSLSQSSRDSDNNASLPTSQHIDSPTGSRPGSPLLGGFMSEADSRPVSPRSGATNNAERPSSASSRPQTKADALRQMIRKTSSVVAPMSTIHDSPVASRTASPVPVIDLEELEDLPMPPEMYSKPLSDRRDNDESLV